MCSNETNELYSGSHTGWNATHTIFFTTWYSTTPPTASWIYIAGTRYTMTLDLGNSSKRKIRVSLIVKALGTYIYISPSTGACRDYFFRFKDQNSTNVHFPQSGSLYTFGVRSVMC